MLGYVVGGGLRVIAIGLSIGAAAALLAGRFIASLLFETSPYDPLALAGAAATLALAGLAASTAAARRATRLDPVAVLNAV
jgi:ABC-type lipoprotein release transport system permease subunit